MANSNETPGRCNAKTRGGGFCARYPVAGKKRCRHHGGAKGSGRPIIHGRYSQKFRAMSQEMSAAIDAAIEDPELLDLRRPLAYTTALLHQWGLMPDDATLRRLAMTPEMAEMGIDPRDIDIEEQRLRFVKAARELSMDVHKMQATITREASIQHALSQAVPAIIGRLFERTRSVIERFVADEDLQGRILDTLADEARVVLVETRQAADKHRQS